MSRTHSKLFTLAQLDKSALRSRCNIDEVFEQFNESVGREIEEIASLRDANVSPIPELSFEQIVESGFTQQEADIIRQRGCVVVRKTFQPSRVEQWNQALSDYLGGVNHYHQKLNEDIKSGNALRAEHPHMLDIYWSQSQLEVRQSSRLHQLQQRLNGLWKVKSSGEGSFNPDLCCSYADRVRIRQPMDETKGLAPHVDSCSMESWFSARTIQKTYESLLNGNWQEYNAFDAVGRVNTTEKPHEDSVGMFRTFQGWMALTAQGRECGTLQLVPSSRCVAWMFLSMLHNALNNIEQVYPIPSEAYLLHPEKHALLIKGLCSIPMLQAGDTVWWHPDAVHAVEKSNQSSHPSSVIYLGIAPDCARNRRYLQEQLPCFLDGRSPPDFPAVNEEVNYVGRGLPEHLSPLGARQMGK